MNDAAKPSSEADRKQVAEQCRVIVHLGKALVEVHSDYERLFRDNIGLSRDAVMLDMVGRRTAAFMEALGNMLNAIDAIGDDDEWTTPIFLEAQRRWPVEV